MRGLSITVCITACLILSLAACGSPLCGQKEPSSPGTTSSGPVPIATDRSVYAPSDTIHITVTNTLDKWIYLVSRLGHQCPTFVVVKEEHGGQRAMNSCAPGGEAPETMGSVSIAPNANVMLIITSAELDQPLVTGRYHIATRYLTYHPSGQDMMHADVIAIGIASASFRICDCATC